MTLEIQKKLQGKFIDACYDGNIATVQHLLDTPALAKHIHINAEDCNALGISLRKGYYALSEYLLSKNSDEKIAGQHVSSAFVNQCYAGNISNLRYLLHSSQFNKYLDLNFDDTSCFKVAYQKGNVEVLQFLILEAGITRDNDRVASVMRSFTGPTAAKLFRDTIELFNKQKLPAKLEADLPKKEEKTVAKMKI